MTPESQAAISVAACFALGLLLCAAGAIVEWWGERIGA
jgi:hypothetical protein